MAYDDATAKMRADFLTRISSIASANVLDENEAGDFTQKDGGIWCRNVILDGNGFNISLGTTITRRNPGVFVSQVFVPVGDGTTVIDSAIAEIISDYSNLTLPVGDAEGTVIRFLACYATKVGSQNGQYQKNVNMPFWMDF